MKRMARHTRPTPIVIKRTALALLLAASGLALSACAHGDLKAPCPSLLSSIWGGALAADECGLMRPVN